MAPGRATAASLAAMADAIDAILPQTQCRQCGFDGCRPYADAVAAGRAEINRCPPGGVAGVAMMATIAGRAPLPLDPSCGTTQPFAIARIDEAACIGCTLCIQACPVDAIVGAAKRMHDVVADLCSGCALCVAPCPVDCIAMVPAGFAWDVAHANAARRRHETRARRLARLSSAEKRVASRADASRTPITGSTDAAAARRQAIVAAAVERAQRLRQRRLDAKPRVPTP